MTPVAVDHHEVPPSGGSLEIGNWEDFLDWAKNNPVPPSGGSLEIGNKSFRRSPLIETSLVPPSGGSLEIGNGSFAGWVSGRFRRGSPFGGIPRNWKR